MNGFAKAFPWLVVGVAALVLIFAMMPPGVGPDRMDLQEFGSIPVVDRGRVKPLDTYARTTLMLISGRQTYQDENDKTQPAIKWVLEVLSSRDTAEKLQVFRIENEEVLAMLGLKPRSETHFRYALDEFAGKWELIQTKAIVAKDMKSDRRSLFQSKLLELAEHMQMYAQLASLETPLMIPPQGPGGEWQPLQMGEAEFRATKKADNATMSLLLLKHAYAKGDAKMFNDTLAVYRKQTEKQFPKDSTRDDLEVFYNHFAPFYQCTLLYVVVFLLACFSWFGWSGPFNRAAFWLAVLTLVVHTGALLGRMYLMNRWFVLVTNLYSSAVFIGWGCVALCLVLECLFNNGIGNVVAACAGGVTMLIGHHLASSGDTLEMMQAVLDTNLWLATHVTCVTMGYTATFVAGALGIVYIVRGVVTPSLDRSTAKALSAMIYGTVCFATLLSFTGTVLGGIWADQSWGRFWGWDPKENGALLIVIWNALILHARWGGMVHARGMAVLAVVGNMVTGWSWFGTNQLQVGLHSYGFSNTLAFGLVIGWALHAGVLVLGVLPMRWWASHDALLMAKKPHIEEVPTPREKPNGKRRGRRATKPGDPGYFAGPA